MVTDPVADMLSAMKNAAKAGKEEVVVPYSNFKEQLAKLLKRKDFISGARKFKEKGKTCFFLAIKLAYDEGGNSKISHLKRISKPGRRVYLPAGEIKPPPLGIKIISTSKGLLTDGEAKRRHLGGEIVAEIW